jgi:hypothetical protein
MSPVPRIRELKDRFDAEQARGTHPPRESTESGAVLASPRCA